MRLLLLLSWLCLFTLFACQEPQADQSSSAAANNSADLSTAGQSFVQDEFSKPNVVQVAVSSLDHTTLVKAVQAAGLVDALSNVGPFTVFAPVNAAFEALPAGVLADLLQPKNKDKLSAILEYHVYVGVIRENIMQDGMRLNQVDGNNVTLNKKEGKLSVNGANILGSVEAANGIVYVIDQVLLPE